MIEKGLKILLLGIVGAFIFLAALFFWFSSGSYQRLNLPASNNFEEVTIVPPDMPNYSFELKYYPSTIDIGAYWYSGNEDFRLILPLEPLEQSEASFVKDGQEWHLFNYSVSNTGTSYKNSIYKRYIGLFSLSPGSNALRYHGAVLVGRFTERGMITKQADEGTLYKINYTYTSSYSEKEWNDVVNKQGLLPPGKSLQLELIIDTTLVQIREAQRFLIES